MHSSHSGIFLLNFLNCCLIHILYALILLFNMRILVLGIFLQNKEKTITIKSKQKWCYCNKPYNVLPFF